MRSKLILAAAMLVLGLSVVASTPALAKGPQPSGGGGGKHGGGSTAGVLTYSPAPVPVGNTFTVTGKGFSPNTTLSVGLAGWLNWYSVQTDSTGSFSFTYPVAMVVCGSMQFEAIQNTTISSVIINVTGC